MSEAVPRDMAKYWWLRSVACSEASMTTQMRGFDLEEPVYEQALHAFSGGFMHLGHACGLLTGAAVAAGFLARERFDDEETGAAAVLYAATRFAKAHPELTGSVNCREITEVDLTNLSGRLQYLREGKGRMCGRLHLKWSPQAHDLINTAFEEFEEQGAHPACANCAVMALKRMAEPAGMAPEDAVVLAGLAGGVGLLGSVCAVLAAGVYALSVAHYKKQEGKARDSRFRGSLEELSGARFRGAATEMRLAFIGSFDSALCRQITQRYFQDIEDYAGFIEQGGCRQVIDFASKWVEERLAG